MSSQRADATLSCTLLGSPERGLCCVALSIILCARQALRGFALAGTARYARNLRDGAHATKNSRQMLAIVDADGEQQR